MKKKRDTQRKSNVPTSWGGLRKRIIIAVLALAGVVALVIYVGPFLRQSNPGGDTVGTDRLRPAPRALAFDSFAGSEACAKCHQEQFQGWRQSTHALAGGLPGEVKLIAPFSGDPLRFRDGVVTPLRKAKGAPVFVVQAAGAAPVEYTVDAVVGGGHMFGGGTQSFFHRMADGTMRFLPFDFSKDENAWFVQLRADNAWVPINPAISLASDLANFPPRRVLGTFSEFSNCQNCHGSQIMLAYDQGQKRFQTRFHSLGINCESCHGPGKTHMEIVSKPGFEKNADIGMKALATQTKDQSLLVCFQCHATKDAIEDKGYLPGAELEDYFSLKLAVVDDTFTVDGRVRSFSYQSSHLYSDCYLNGSMSCVSCHDPHSQGYRDVFGEPLVGRFDNRQCTSCHASKAERFELHTHHKADSPGSACTACHMPFLQHRGVGRHIRFTRSDHSIPIPRPGFDQQLGIENACQKCHGDKDVAWQQSQVEAWYGPIKPHHPMVASLMTAEGATNREVAQALLLQPEARHPMAQMAGLKIWTERFLHLRIAEPEPDVIAKLKKFAESGDADLQGLALMALDIGYDHRPEVADYLDRRREQMMGRERAIAKRWAVSAYYFANAFMGEGNFGDAIRCFHKALRVRDDNVVVMSNLALAYLRSGDSERAVEWLRTAINREPHRAALHFQLGQTYARTGQVPAAIKAVEEGLKYAATDEKARQLLHDLRRRGAGL